MAGFRTFATGEVLTAANVNNFLMKQSVMVFADAAARTAALGAEVTEGMLTYNEDTAQLEVFDGSAFVLAAPAPPAGIGSNVVSTVKTDVFTTSSATFTAITGFSASITPSSATSKILVMADMKITNTGARGGHVRLLRGASAVYLGDAAGSRILVSASGTGDYPNRMNSTHATVVFLDSPASAAAVTYSFDARVGSGDIFALNRYSRDNDGIDDPRMPSSITLIEVAA